MDIAKKDLEGNSQIVLYQPNETISIEVKLDVEYDTVWLSIDQMAQLFGRDKSVIGKHVRAVFKDGELQKDSVWAKFAYTASDGKTYQVDYYNLDVIISVGYRVKSVQGTQLRVWASFALTVNTPIKFISKRTFLKLPAIRQQLLSDPTFVHLLVHRMPIRERNLYSCS